jgi:hypothetical protein
MSVRRAVVVSGVVGVLAASAALAATVAPGRAGSSLPRCTIGQLAFAVKVEGTAGALVPSIEVWHVSGPKCHLERRVSLAVKTASGAFLGVEGNPGRHTFRRDLALHRGVFAAWGWSNWCKKPGKATYRFTFGPRTFILRTDSRPSCVQPGGASHLRFLRAGAA